MTRTIIKVILMYLAASMAGCGASRFPNGNTQSPLKNVDASQAFKQLDPFLFLEKSPEQSHEVVAWIKHHNGEATQLESSSVYSAFHSYYERLFLPPVSTDPGQAPETNSNSKLTAVSFLTANNRQVPRFVNNVSMFNSRIDAPEITEPADPRLNFSFAICAASNGKKCLHFFSYQGSGLSVFFEFDEEKKSVVKDGFNLLTIGNHTAEWLDEDTLILRTSAFDLGSEKPYPGHKVVAWKRNTPLSSAKVILESPDPQEDLGVEFMPFYNYRSRGMEYFAYQLDKYARSKIFKIKTPSLEIEDLGLPQDSVIYGIFNNQLIIKTDVPWTISADRVIPEGSLLAVSYSDGNNIPEIIIAGDNTENIAVQNGSIGRKYLGINAFENGLPLPMTAYKKSDGSWATEKIKFDFPSDVYQTNISVIAYPTGDFIYLTAESFIFGLHEYQVSRSVRGDWSSTLIRKADDIVESQSYVEERNFAESQDGTAVPYFIIYPRNIKYDGSTPTLVYSYGGFGEASILISPFNSMYKPWMKLGGALVIVSPRGGNEFGPEWHHQAMGAAKRIKVLQDMVAAINDLNTRGISNPKKTGIFGHSNGGLLACTMGTLFPQLVGAVNCSHAPLDLIRSPKLSSGYAWIGEYGDPEDINDLIHLLELSPYENIKPQVKYPAFFINTATHDDVVHPAHARKMTAKLEGIGEKPYFVEYGWGGHSIGTQLTVDFLSKQGAFFYEKLFEATKQN